MLNSGDGDGLATTVGPMRLVRRAVSNLWFTGKVCAQLGSQELCSPPRSILKSPPSLPSLRPAGSADAILHPYSSKRRSEEPSPTLSSSHSQKPHPPTAPHLPPPQASASGHWHHQAPSETLSIISPSIPTAKPLTAFHLQGKFHHFV